jgi:hypothetical protein
MQRHAQAHTTSDVVYGVGKRTHVREDTTREREREKREKRREKRRER